MTIQRESQNPDVNSLPDDNYGATEDVESNLPSGGGDIEQPDRGDDIAPVPPDRQPIAPIEEPPGSDGPPVGDVDDSPARIANDE